MHYVTSKDSWHQAPMSNDDKKIMHEWTSVNDAAVWQLKVRQETTMARTGILPEACYPKKLLKKEIIHGLCWWYLESEEQIYSKRKFVPFWFSLWNMLSFWWFCFLSVLLWLYMPYPSEHKAIKWHYYDIAATLKIL